MIKDYCVEFKNRQTNKYTVLYHSDSIEDCGKWIAENYGDKPLKYGEEIIIYARFC